MPFSGGKSFFIKSKQKQNNKTPKETKNKRVQGQVRWPFGPPHLTLKPSRKNINPPKNKRITNKEGLGPSEVARSLWVIRQFFLLVGVQHFPFWRTQKRYTNRGFSKAFFEKQTCVTKRPFYHILSFWKFLLFQKQKHQKCWNPNFYSVLANIKRGFSKIILKTEYLFDNCCTLLVKKTRNF